jgi:hypothetical protein
VDWGLVNTYLRRPAGGDAADAQLLRYSLPARYERAISDQIDAKQHFVETDQLSQSQVKQQPPRPDPKTDWLKILQSGKPLPAMGR